MAKLIRIIELRSIRVWEEKSKESGYPKGSLRIYVGGMWMGVAIPDKEALKEGRELYRYSSIETFIDGPDTRMVLQDMLDDLEVSLKEFASKFVKKLVVLKKVKEIDLPD